MLRTLRPQAVIAIAICIAAITQSCEHDSLPGPDVIKKWEDVHMTTAFEVPAIANRNEEGDATITLYSDNSLEFSFHIHNLTAGDVLTAAHIHAGDAATAGGVLINFNPSFVGPGASGKVSNLRQGQVDSLLNMPVYVNVHSSQVGSGLVRGQLDKTVDFAKDLTLSGLNEVGPVTTTATGTAVLRLTTDKILYSKVSVANLEANDTFTVSHIHRGAAGVNGPVRIFLANSEADFNIVKVSAPLADSLVTLIKADPAYVNVHSRKKPGGIIRGQIR
jgi:hypothetical protein